MNYCMSLSNKTWPAIYRKLLYKMGQDFSDTDRTVGKQQQQPPPQEQQKLLHVLTAPILRVVGVWPAVNDIVIYHYKR